MQQLIRKMKYMAGLAAIFFATPAIADWQMNMPRGVTPISRDIYDLHMFAIWVCVAIGIVVFSVMTYSLIMHRKSRGVKPAEFHEHPVLEIVWSIIPFIILVVLAIPATRVLLDMEDTSEADVTIKIVGHQWKWQYEYLDQNIRFFSNLSTPFDQIQNKTKKGEHYLLEVDKPIVVPINKKIRFLVTSQDVIHSWWVPDLAVKRDAVPGFIHEAWALIDKPGTYRGQCAELCGIFHGFMPIVVEAVSEEAFEQWVLEQNPNAKAVVKPYQRTLASTSTDSTKQVDESKSEVTVEPEIEVVLKTFTKDELIENGEALNNQMCAACHKVDGTGMPPVFPALKGNSVVIGEPISRHIEVVLNGVPGTAMQAFADQLTDEQIAAIITYQRNAWHNNTANVIQPADVAKLRNQ